MTLLAATSAAAPEPAGPGPQELAWDAAEAETVAAMAVVNAGVARLVGALTGLLAAGGWQGAGIRSPEHWVCWKAAVGRSRADGLVRIARRVGELPACWALFCEGRLGEDAMVRIARRVPTPRDAEMAALAPSLLISQLDRLLASLPEVPDPDAAPRPDPERALHLRHGRDGWLRGSFCVPPDEGAVVRSGLLAARDAEFRDRNGLGPDDDIALADPHGDGTARPVSWADGLVRMASEAADALDPALVRTGHRGERNQIVLHVDVDRDGGWGPAQLEHGPTVPDGVARYLACDAGVQVMTHRVGRLAGIHPTVRTPNRAMRRYLARRDQGCTHPLCAQRLWLHAHHIVFWSEGGRSEPSNLVLPCPHHHRALHHGEFSIAGDPEAGTLHFVDRFGRPIEPPDPVPPGGAGPPGQPPPRFTPPLGEPFTGESFTWN